MFMGFGMAGAAIGGVEVDCDPTAVDSGHNQLAGDISIELGDNMTAEITLPHGVSFTAADSVDVMGAMVVRRNPGEIRIRTFDNGAAPVEIGNIRLDIDAGFKGGVMASIRVWSQDPTDAEAAAVEIARVEYENISGTVSILASTPVNIPDANLEAYLRGILNIPTGDIMDTDMDDITYIDASSLNIQDITGLETAVNVHDMILNNNQISDLAPVADLPKVVYLKVNNNLVSTIPDLSGMDVLADLELEGNGISDISPLGLLSASTTLDYIDLNNNSIADISALTGLSELKWLYLENNTVNDISSLAGLSELTYLELDNNNISSITSLTGLSNLEVLDLEGNEVSGISALAGLTKLTKVDLAGNNVSDIAALAGKTSLVDLYLSYNLLDNSDLSNLSGLSALDDLDLSGNNLSNLTPLAGLTTLQYLGLSENSIVDISPLATLTGLKSLGLYDNQIVNISALDGMNGLTELYLGFNQIASVAALADNTLLQTLRLEYNNIVDITPLAGLTALKELFLHGNDIVTVPALILPNLNTLTLNNNYINDVSGLEDLADLTYLDLGSNAITDITALADLDALSWLNLDYNYLHVIDTLLDMSGLTDVDLGYNYLNTTPGSPAMDVVDALEDDGVDVILAIQREDPALHSVTYNGNTSTSGTVPVDSSSYQEYDTVTVKANSGNLAKTGYVFAGWNTSANGSGTTYAPGSTFEMGFENVILYAKWTTGSSDVEAFVTRFYEECLGRSPEQSEVDYWVDQLESGESTGADVAFGFVYSDEFQSNDLTDEEYLEVLYTAFFNRTPAPSELNYWVDQLDSGMSRVGVLAGFLEATEFSNLCDDYGITPRGDQDVEAFVTRFYLECLSRVPDPAGLADWVDQLESGAKTGADVAYGFVYSTEFQAKTLTKSEYINILYGAFFDRVPDSSGKTYWLDLLNSGTSRLEVLAGFVNSNEFADLCDEYGITPGQI